MALGSLQGLEVQNLSRPTVEAEPCGWGQRQSGAGPALHTPSYHIWQKLMFSKFKDLISERAEEEAHGEWCPRSASLVSLGTVGVWLEHGCRGGPWGPNTGAHHSVHWPGAVRGSGILESRGGGSSMLQQRGGMSLPGCWTHLEHTQYTRLQTRARDPRPALTMLTDPGV